MKKMIAAVALVAASLLPVRATAQAVHDHSYDSPKTTLTVDQPLVVGTTVLKPGEYKFQCRTFGDKTFLVVTSAESNKEITRVPCVKETLSAAVTDSQFRSIARPDGTRVLVTVKFKGEAVAHNVVIN